MEFKPELEDANAAYKHFLIDNTGFEITFTVPNAKQADNRVLPADQQVFAK